MIRANFYYEPNLAQASSRGGHAKRETAPLSILLHCDYITFCRYLGQKHGDDYLRRPDGDAMNGVPDAAFAPLPPARAPRPVNPHQLPPTYTGNAMEDLRTQPKIKAQGRWSGPTLRHRVLDALRERPMTLREICMYTGIERCSVKNVLHRYRGTYFKNENHYWSEIQNTVTTHDEGKPIDPDATNNL